MKIVFFSHPNFLGQQSMPRFAKMLADGMSERGHNVEIWFPQPKIIFLPLPRAFKKWLGYIDQYVLFPISVLFRLRRCPSNTFFVFTDHALGPWVPLVINRPHVIHCHDFLAQQSAKGEIAENQTGFTGRLYQSYIHRGYSSGKYFISVSFKTREKLHYFLSKQPLYSEVVYNGLNQSFSPIKPEIAKAALSTRINIDLSVGYLLHVGGNYWYKNRAGVIEIYNAWRTKNNYQYKIPLLLIGDAPDKKVRDVYEKSPFKADIYILNGINDECLRLAYTGATAFIFPSLAEGFGWPIAEAMASGCPVITTDEAPMTEVAGNAGYFIPRRPLSKLDAIYWASKAAEVVDKVICLSPAERIKIVKAGIENAKRFDPVIALDRIEALYQDILSLSTKANNSKELYNNIK